MYFIIGVTHMLGLKHMKLTLLHVKTVEYEQFHLGHSNESKINCNLLNVWLNFFIKNFLTLIFKKLE